MVRGPAAIERRRGGGAVGECQHAAAAADAEPARRAAARGGVGASASCDEHPPVDRVPSRTLLLACVLLLFLIRSRKRGR